MIKIRHLLIVLLTCTLIIFMNSCGNDTVSVSKDEYEKLKQQSPVLDVYPKQIYFFDKYNENGSIILADSCEYITRWYGGNAGILTHKGNCKFCEKRMDKRFEDLKAYMFKAR